MSGVSGSPGSPESSSPSPSPSPGVPGVSFCSGSVAGSSSLHAGAMQTRQRAAAASKSFSNLIY
ncbi:MAG: hypothetical protein EGR50_04225 [Alistipes communis]|nr:hypothetical protein F2X94_16280 [Alistipes onderdonkii]MBD9350503.1 hypothetical protein [Alistipes communis]HCP58058.1 hypothetical protein [Alistipes communis]